MQNPPATEGFPPLDATAATFVPCGHRRAGLHGPVTSGWLLAASVSQLTVAVAIVWCGIRAHPLLTVPAALSIAGVLAVALWLVPVVVLALGRARFRHLERRYVAWLDGLTAEQRVLHGRQVRARLLEHEAAPRHWVVPADW